MGLRLPLLLIQRRVQIGHASVRNADAGQYLANEGSAADVRARPWSGLHGHTKVSQLMRNVAGNRGALSISLSGTRVGGALPKVSGGSDLPPLQMIVQFVAPDPSKRPILS